MKLKRYKLPNKFNLNAFTIQNCLNLFYIKSFSIYIGHRILSNLLLLTANPKMVANSNLLLLPSWCFPLALIPCTCLLNDTLHFVLIVVSSRNILSYTGSLASHVGSTYLIYLNLITDKNPNLDIPLQNFTIVFPCFDTGLITTAFDTTTFLLICSLRPFFPLKDYISAENFLKSSYVSAVFFLPM